jgi:hypothetical protein
MTQKEQIWNEAIALGKGLVHNSQTDGVTNIVELDMKISEGEFWKIMKEWDKTLYSLAGIPRSTENKSQKE